MALLNSAKTISIGYGNPSFYSIATGIVAAAATTTNIAAAMVPATPFSPTFRSGRIHLKCSAATGTGQITGISISITDGTTTEWIYANIGATVFPVGAQPNILVEFITDLQVNNIVVNVIMSVAAQTTTWDLEIVGST